MRWFVVVVAILGAAAPLGAAPGVTVVQAADPAITEGDVVIDGDPAEVFAAAQDYRRWPAMMPDVARVEIADQHGVDAHVTLVSPSGHRDNLTFHNQPQARMIYFEDTGNGGRAEVWAEIVFVPAAQPASTRVHIRLYAKVHGVATLVASDRAIRERRESTIAADLAHIRAYFQRQIADR